MTYISLLTSECGNIWLKVRLDRGVLILQTSSMSIF